MLTEVASRSFANGQVYMLKTEDQFPLEVTDTFLPFLSLIHISEPTRRSV